MKHTRNLLALAGIILLGCSFYKSEEDCSLVKTPKINNKLMFYHNEPVNEYEVAFTFSNIIDNIDCNNAQQNMDATIHNANMEAANQGRLYDAIIVGSNTDRDIAITWKDKTKDNSIARIGRTEGIYAFIGCEPMCKYEVVFKKDVSRPGLRMVMNQCPSDNQMIAALMKGADKQGISYDAVLIGNSKNDMVIKFIAK